MKKLVLAFIASLFAFGAFSQNIQLHYDLGKDRGYLTSTVEMFRPDKTGNTFFFIDFDYGVGDVEGVSLSYFEIARCFKLGKSPFSWHGEYNGGFGQIGNAPGSAYQINNAWLTGINYSWNASDFSRGFSLKTLFKTIQGKNDASFQLTGVWYLNFAKGKMTFSGFADFWREDSDFNFDGKTDAKFTFLSEPQLWYNFNKNFAAGGEIELSNNFGGMEGFNVMPTLGAKYTF